MYKIDDNKKDILNHCCEVCSQVKMGDIICSIGKDIDEDKNETPNLTSEEIEKINSMCENHNMLGNILASIIAKNNGGEEPAIEIDENIKKMISSSCISFESIGELLGAMSKTINAPTTTEVTFSGNPQNGTIVVKKNEEVIDAEENGTYILGEGNYTFVGTLADYREYNGSFEVTQSDIKNGTKTVSFEYIPIKSLTSGDITIQLSQNEYSYSGLDILPEVTVKDNSIVLENNTDYTVEYSNNKNSGSATVTVVGKGNYKDSKSTNFTINKVTLTPTAQANDKQFDGTATATGTITLSGAVNSEQPTATGVFVFEDSTGAIGNDKTVNVTVTLDDGWTTNYVLSTTSLTTTANITE